MIGARGALRVSLAALLLVSAVVFAVGTSLERNKHDDHDQAHQAATSSSETAAAGEAAEAEEGHDEEAEANEASQGHAETGGEAEVGSDEKIFGINPESIPLIAAGIAISVLLAIAVWTTQPWQLLALIVGFGLVFAALDAREAVHQFNENNRDIATIAIVLATLHVAVSSLAAILLRRRTARTAAS